MSPEDEGINQREVFVCSFARTAVGSFLGTLAGKDGCELGGIAIAESIKRAGVNGELIDEVFMGNVISAGLGQAPATRAAQLAGLPVTTPATTINKVCASGMKAITLAVDTIASGNADIVVAGGMESMSRAPYLLPSTTRQGLKYGNQFIIDSLEFDGLKDAATGLGMGDCGERCAAEYGLSLDSCNQFANLSFQRAIDSKMHHSKDIVSINTTDPKTRTIVTVSEDEGPLKYNPEKMAKLRPAFKEGGSLTAANSSPLSDGAAALVLCSRKAVEKYNLRPLAQIISHADANQQGVDFTTSPSLAIPKALKKINLDIEKVECFEINEAFSSVALANAKILNIDLSKINLWGGAIALGHPLGCSGARITGTLISIMRENKFTYGVASVCHGGGGASAIVLKSIP